MKITEIFDNVRPRSSSINTSVNVLTNNSFITMNGITSTGSGGAFMSGFSQNSMSDGSNSVRTTKRFKLLGITIWKKIFEVSVEDFFHDVKMSKNDIKIIDGAIEKYIKSIEKAKTMGQVALVEKMKDDIEVIKKETLSVVCGVKEYLTEEQVEKLLMKTTKNIEITYIKNFVRPIPDALLEKKKKLDEHNVFDEYVVMHYDPKKKNSELTKKEIAKKKDPILFGIIAGSRNFYYIGDWIDEHCNLTLKEALTIIDDKVKKI